MLVPTLKRETTSMSQTLVDTYMFSALRRITSRTPLDCSTQSLVVYGLLRTLVLSHHGCNVLQRSLYAYVLPSGTKFSELVRRHATGGASL